MSALYPIEILLVEDNPGDAELTEVALKDAKVSNRLSIVKDGKEAMDFLLRNGRYKDSPTPDLILLDLNLPKKNGREVLKEIKDDEILRRIPVVVLTSSRAEEDIIKSYSHHANCYISKPVDLEQFMKVIELIDEFWLTVVKLPSRKIGA